MNIAWKSGVRLRSRSVRRAATIRSSPTFCRISPAQRGAPGGAQEVAERRVVAEVAAQHHRGGEVADHPLGPWVFAAEDGDADADVPLAAVAGEQRLERGQQHHEHRAALGPRQRFEPVEEVGRKAEGTARRGRNAPVGGDGRSAGPAPARRPAARSSRRATPRRRGARPGGRGRGSQARAAAGARARPPRTPRRARRARAAVVRPTSRRRRCGAARGRARDRRRRAG